MANATQALEYNNDSPLTYDQWKDRALTEGLKSTGNFWKDVGKGIASSPDLVAMLFGAGKYGRKNYNDYVDDFYNKQSIHNASISEIKQREFEKMMSDTAYQRAYKDIEATGLNPAILLNSAFNSASTPSSSSAFSRSSSSNSSRNESNSKSFNSSAILAAFLYIVAHMI